MFLGTSVRRMAVAMAEQTPSNAPSRIGLSLSADQTSDYLLTALHLPGPHTRAKSRLLAVGGQNRARRGLSAGGRWLRTFGPSGDRSLRQKPKRVGTRLRTKA
jgi:hypothetical protein